MAQDTGKKMSWTGIAAPYQWNIMSDIPVFLYFDHPKLEQQWQEGLYQQGFELVSSEQLQDSSQKSGFRILKISTATPRVQRKIQTLPLSSPHEYGESSYGFKETLENYAYYEIYILYQQALMIQSSHSVHWECAISNQFDSYQADAINIVIARYLSAATAFHQILGFWGEATSEKLFKLNRVATQPGQWLSLDLKRGNAAIGRQLLQMSDIEFLLPSHIVASSKEQLFGWLASNTLYFSAGQIPKSYIQEQIYKWMARNFDLGQFRKNIDLVS